jgi:CRISPR-associated protein (TIGR03984 family)
MGAIELPTASIVAIEDPSEVVRQVLECDEPNARSVLLGHMADGIVWGAVRDGRWVLSCSAHPRLSPRLDVRSLLLLRIFDQDGETFLWRDEDAGLRGRRLEDGAPRGPDDPLRWLDETHLVRGDRLIEGAPASDHFTPVADARGARHVPPLRWHHPDEPSSSPATLLVRHHLRCDDESGCVRIVASRCVELSTQASA